MLRHVDWKLHQGEGKQRLACHDCAQTARAQCQKNHQAGHARCAEVEEADSADHCSRRQAS